MSNQISLNYYCPTSQAHFHFHFHLKNCPWYIWVFFECPHLFSSYHWMQWNLFFSSVQWLSCVRLFAADSWTAARQASLSITNSWSLLRLLSIESVMPYNHLILGHPLLLLLSSFPSIRVFSNELVLCIRWPKYWKYHQPFLGDIKNVTAYAYGKLNKSFQSFVIIFQN